MKKGRIVYQGKAKILYRTTNGRLIQHFKDDATAFNNEKRGKILGKGIINNSISTHIMERLNRLGIPTHFVRRINLREQLVQEVEIIPLEVVVRNIAAGSICQRLGLKEGKPLPRSLVEFYLKEDKLGDPLVSEEHINAFGWATPEELDEITNLATQINYFLSGMFDAAELNLVDFKLEFGRLETSDATQIVLADEISPDSCRLWDKATGNKLDKDRFRMNLGKVAEGYQEVARRLKIVGTTKN